MQQDSFISFRNMVAGETSRDRFVSKILGPELGISDRQGSDVEAEYFANECRGKHAQQALAKLEAVLAL